MIFLLTPLCVLSNHPLTQAGMAKAPRIGPTGAAGWPKGQNAARKVKVGDRPQGVAGDCNSLAETHAWFDSRVAHHPVSKKP